MGKGHLCSAFGCNNRSSTSTARFHAFPRDMKRCKHWIQNLRRADLDKVDCSNFFRNRKVCSDHFEDKMYMNPMDRKSSLMHWAYPTLISVNNPPPTLTPKRPLPVRQPISPKRRKVEELKSTVEVIDLTPDHRAPDDISDADNDSICTIPMKRKPACALHCSYRQRYQNLRKKNLQLHRTIYRLKRQVSKLKLKENDKSLIQTISPVSVVSLRTPKEQNPLPVTVQKFIESQKAYYSVKKRGMRWDDHMIKFALSIRYKSPSAYLFLSTHFGLPSISILQERLLNSMPSAGLCSSTLQLLKNKFENTSQPHNFVSLSFDGMKIKKCLQYLSNDEIDGFEQSGNSERSNKVADEMVVFMINGLSFSWKQPLSYYFVSGPAKRILLNRVLGETIQQLKQCGLRTMSIVCDQEPAHQGMFGLEVSNNNSFKYSSEECFVLYDVPHLLKSTRNTLLNYYIQYDNTFIDFQYVIQLFEYEKGCNVRMAYKLTDAHINPNNFQKMKVKYAAQVLSNTVSAALLSLIELKKMPEEARSTAVFIKRMDLLFDILNSTRLGRPGRAPITASNVEANIAQLKWYSEWIDSWKFISRSTGKKRDSMPSQKGWVLTLKSMCSLIPILLNSGISHVCTRRLNQDCLENTFSLVRAKGGHNTHPTLVQAKAAIRAISCNNLLKPTSRSRNCEDSDNVALSIMPPRNVQKRTAVMPTGIPFHSVDLDEETGTNDFDQENLPLDLSCQNDDEALLYVTGSLIRRHIDCQKCFANLNPTENVSSPFIENRTLLGCQMLHPKKSLLPSVRKLHNFVTEILKEVAHLPQLSQIIYREVDSRNLTVGLFPECSCMCKHNFVLGFIKFLIKLYCKNQNKIYIDNKRKHSQKVSKLK